jgi:hypothetical protein
MHKNTTDKIDDTLIPNHNPLLYACSTRIVFEMIDTLVNKMNSYKHVVGAIIQNVMKNEHNN